MNIDQPAIATRPPTGLESLHELSGVLSERVRQGVEGLISASHEAIGRARREGRVYDHKDLYVAGSRIVMRCIITLFAEARGLLPMENRVYRRAFSLETLRERASRDAWRRLIALFRLIHAGSTHSRMSVPCYGGALFEPGRADSDDGISRALALLESPENRVDDLEVMKLLRLLTRARMRPGRARNGAWIDVPVDFARLSSEYIGVLYEGLLDFELKQAADDDPVIFLAVGNQPAFTLSQLESLSDKTVAQLFDALSKKDTRAIDEDDEAPADSIEDDAEPESLVRPQTLSPDHAMRIDVWLARAAALSGVKSGQANTLCARFVAPGEFYLVRWGGTRKGAGTFFTRPQLAEPTVRRTLQPLAYDASRSETDVRTGLDTVIEWTPKTPEQILSIKVCDPAMGSGSFLASALRYLTDALTESLFHHDLLTAHARLSALFDDDVIRLDPRDARFEQALRAQLKRHVVENCLYGVDLDPLAVELGRMALWVETMDRGLPFGFIDHKLKVGNALVGAWFDSCRDYPAMAWAREGGDKDYQKDKPGNLVNHRFVDAKGRERGDVFTEAIKARARLVSEQLRDLLDAPDAEQDADTDHAHDALLDVLRKLQRLPLGDSERRAQVYRTEWLDSPLYHTLRARLDLWCALWFWPGEKIAHAPLPLDFSRPDAEAMSIATDIARQQRFFHWELEFPDVFTAAHQGFDALLGNPPWETVQPDSKEFFAHHDPLYRAYGKQEALAKQLDYFRRMPLLEREWIAYRARLKAFANWMNFCGIASGDRVIEDKDGKRKHDFHLGGRGRSSFDASIRLHAQWRKRREARRGFSDRAHPFVHQGQGKPYLHKMFLELSHALLRPQGRLGMIVPGGILGDKGSTELRTLFFERCDWQWLFGFENRTGIFDIHRSFRFCVLIVQKGGETRAMRAAFMHRDAADWQHAERHVMAYPRARVEAFSPRSKAILEIGGARDLHTLQKIYDNGVLFGDRSERGWGIRYRQGDFNMTSDSALFAPRPDWEDKGYRADEYGHWLKGAWFDYDGPMDILERDDGLVLSRDGRQAIAVDTIHDVALPLLEGNIIDQFEASAKGWLSGKGRAAVWRDIAPAEGVFEPQYLIGLKTAAARVSKSGDDVGQPKWRPAPKVAFIDVTSATNMRTARATCTPYFPCGNTAAVLCACESVFALATVMNSFVYDFVARARCGGLHLNGFAVEESVLPRATGLAALDAIGRRLICTSRAFCGSQDAPPAIGDAERLRLRCIADALVAQCFELSIDDFAHILAECDYPASTLTDEFASTLNAKGFWRVDRDKDPELRHTVLAYVAFCDLKARGVEAFVAQNKGEGWMIPERLRLADHALGRDERALVAQRVSSRFVDVDAEWSPEVAAAHGALVRRIVEVSEAATFAAEVEAES